MKSKRIVTTYYAFSWYFRFNCVISSDIGIIDTICFTELHVF